MAAPRPTFRFPFQEAFERFVINPVTNWERFFNPQFFISYNTTDVTVENHVLSRVGSYGKQLGRLIDVVSVLLAHVRLEELTPQERRVLDRFHDLSVRVDTAVADVQGPPPAELTTSDIERVVDRLETLARTDPASHRRLVARLRTALALDDPPVAAG